MPGRITELSETQIIADILRAQRRQAANAISQAPQAYKDELTVASTPQTTMQLTYIPQANSIDLKWNSLGTIEGTDYTVDYTTGIVTFLSPLQTLLKATPAPADTIEAQYTTTGDLIALSGPADLGDITDTFNRANSASTVNPASDGGTWTDDAGAFGINGNAAYSFGAGSGTFWDFSGKVIHRDLHSAVQVVQVDVLRAVSGNNSRIYLNLSTGSPGSAYALVWNVGNDFKLYKSFSNGTATTLIAGPISAGSLLGAYHTVKGTSDGAGTLRFYVDGTHIAGLDYTDGSPLTGTRVGLGLYTADTGTNFLFDNFSASQS